MCGGGVTGPYSHVAVGATAVVTVEAGAIYQRSVVTTAAGGDMRQLETLRKRIVDDLRSEILCTPRVELVEPETLPRSEGKAVRVIDNRKQWG